MEILLGLLVGAGAACAILFPMYMGSFVASLKRIANALEISNTRSRRFTKTFIVDVDGLEDLSLEEALDEEIGNLLGKDIKILSVQDTFYKKDTEDPYFHGAVRTILYSKL